MAGRYGLEIRAADAGDAAGLATLMRTAGVPTPERTVARRIEAVRAAGGLLLLAVEWGPPSGVVCLGWLRTLESDDPVAFVTTLLVDPEARRRGIARLLVKAASQAARTAGCSQLRLPVSAPSDGLREFCLATGFTEAGALFTRGLRKRG